MKKEKVKINLVTKIEMASKTMACLVFTGVVINTIYTSIQFLTNATSNSYGKFGLLALIWSVCTVIETIRPNRNWITVILEVLTVATLLGCRFICTLL